MRKSLKPICRMWLVPAVFTFLIVIASHTAVGQSQEELVSQGWVHKTSKDGIQIYNREKPGSGIKELMAITEVDAPSWRLFAVVGDYDKFKDFMPYTVVSKILKTERIDEKTRVTYWITALDLPLVSNRYYTLKLVDRMDADGRACVCESRWTLSREKGLDPSWDDPSVRHLFPPNFAEPVKTPVNDGYWLFEPINNGARTRVSYYVYTDPGGMVPEWIANKANLIAVPRLMNALRERVKDPAYDDAPRCAME